MKKKTWILLGIMVVIVLVVGGVCFYHFYKQEEENKKIKAIEDSYASTVQVLNRKTLYQMEDDRYIEVGFLEKGMQVSLLEKQVVDSSDIYYQIQDTSFYIDYQDIKETSILEEDTSLDTYLPIAKIKTSVTNLYQEKRLVASIEESMEFQVFRKVDEWYFIQYLGQVYEIKDSFEVVEEYQENLVDISILNFSDDISLSKLEEVLGYLKNNEYQTILIDDFNSWVKKEVYLDKNSVLLLSYQELTSEKLELVLKYGMVVNTQFSTTFESGDAKVKVGDSKYYKYEILNTTSLDRVKDMLLGIKVKIVTSPTVAVLNYHFFYNSSIGESCNETICLEISNFRKQLTYLKENNFHVLTMQEMNDWMDKKIVLPEKSVLITIDDGAMGTSKINGNLLMPILEEFEMPASLFLITGWWEKANYESSYLEVYSHGDELHHNNFCWDDRCSYKALLLTKEELKEDLLLSTEKVGSNLAFCYPFYQKNNTMVEALKETGFSLAFLGGNKKAKQSDSKLALPRYVIYKNTSLDSFIKMVNP